MLPILALLFERVINTELFNFITPFVHYRFLKGSGTQDCKTAVALFSSQALESHQECQVISLGIKGAFNHIWWNGLLQHLSCGFCSILVIFV